MNQTLLGRHLTHYSLLDMTCQLPDVLEYCPCALWLCLWAFCLSLCFNSKVLGDGIYCKSSLSLSCDNYSSLWPHMSQSHIFLWRPWGPESLKSCLWESIDQCEWWVLAGSSQSDAGHSAATTAAATAAATAREWQHCRALLLQKKEELLTGWARAPHQWVMSSLPLPPSLPPSLWPLRFSLKI